MNLIELLDKSFDWSIDRHDGYFDHDGVPRDRVIRHDVLHLLIIGEQRKRPIKLKFEDEYAAAIVQAVLEGRVSVSKVPYSRKGKRDIVGDDEAEISTIREKTIPKIVGFLQDVYTALGRPLPDNFRDDVSDEFIQKYLHLGKAFKEEFKLKYGTEYVSADIDHFVEIPFTELQTVYARAELRATYGIPAVANVLQP